MSGRDGDGEGAEGFRLSPGPGCDLREFVRLVREMRAVQTRWFRGDKSSETLRQARDYERRVDRAVAEMSDDQPRLFT